MTMAIDPNAEVPQFTGYMDDPATWPTTLPEGVTKDPDVWYARRITFGDGRTVWEFRKRGSGDGPDGKGDKVFATTPGVPIKSVKEAYDKETEAAAKPPAAPARQVINGVPHQYGGKDANGNDIWTPVQTPSGPAQPTTTTQTTPRPPGGKEVTEGTPTGQLDANGQPIYDNERPRKVIKDASGKEIWSEELTGTDLAAWRDARARSRNPGGKSDAETAADKDKADREAAAAPKDEVNPSDPTRLRRWNPTTRVYDDAGPNAAGVRANQAGEKREDIRGKDGKVYTRVTKVNPQTGKDETYYENESGQRVPPPDDSKPGIPANAPVYTPVWGTVDRPNADLGLIAYASQVRARPDLTMEQQNQLIKEAHATASASAGQVTSTLAAQQAEGNRRTTERSQDVSMANQRLSTSSANFGTSVKQAADDTKYSLGPEAASVLPYYLAMGMGSAQAYGGLNTPAAVQLGPAAQQMQQMPGPWGAAAAQGQTRPAAVSNAVAAPQQAAALPSPIFSPQPPAPFTGAPVDPASIGAPEGSRPNPAAGEPGNNPNQIVGRMDLGPLQPSPTGITLDPTRYGHTADNPMMQSQQPSPFAPMLGADPRMAQTLSSDGIEPPPGAYYPLDPRPPATYDREGIDRTNDPLRGPPGLVEPWPNLQADPGAMSRQPLTPQQPNRMAAMMGAGPWGQPPQQPTGAGAVAMQSAQGGYDPSSTNQMLVQAGISPEIIKMFGGVLG